MTFLLLSYLGKGVTFFLIIDSYLLKCQVIRLDKILVSARLCL